MSVRTSTRTDGVGLTYTGLNTYKRVIFQFLFFNKCAQISTFVFFCPDGAPSEH